MFDPSLVTFCLPSGNREKLISKFPMPQPSRRLDLFSLWRNSQKLRYLAIGAWNTFAGYLIFAGLYLVIGARIGYMLTALLSHVLAVIQSFVTQRQFVFRSQGVWWVEYTRFNITHSGSLLIGLMLLPVLIEMFDFQPLVAQAIATVLTVFLSYFLHKNFTFLKPRL